METIYWHYPFKIQHYRDFTVIFDWSGNEEDYSDSCPLSTAESWEQGLSAGVCYSSAKFSQTCVRKLAAAVGTVTGRSVLQSLFAPERNCFRFVKLLYVEKIKISMNAFVFNVSCSNCILTNCISQMGNHTRVLMLKQPSL